MKRRSVVHYILSLTLLALSFACQKQLTAEGLSNFGPSLYVQPDSSIKVFSYLNNYPEYVTNLSYQGEAITVPKTVLTPKLNFGSPENPLIYVNRANPSVATPVDLFIKVYSPSSPSPDYYFEIPVLGSPLVPTNVTTALSWVLRFGFNQEVVAISKNQFDAMVTKIEVVCIDCRQKTNSEVANLIVSNPQLVSALLDFLQASNPTKTLDNVNYNPPALDYAWSEPTVGPNWKILTSFNEPVQDLLTQLFNPVTLNVDAILVAPLNSSPKVRPDYWLHGALLNDSTAINQGLESQLPQVNNTPLIYNFDSLSSGQHTFISQYNGSASSPLQVKASVLDKNMRPSCVATTELTVRANRVLTQSVDKTIKPELLSSLNVAQTRLSTTEVNVFNVSSLPSVSNIQRYDIVFDTLTAAPDIFYSIEKTNLANVTSVIASGQRYASGAPVSFEGYTVFISGTPDNGDKVRFYSPATSQTVTSTGIIDGLGCIDPDPSTSTSLVFTRVSGPNGAFISSTGRISWATETADYNSLNPNQTVPFTFTATDDTGVTQQFTVQIKVTEDKLPQLCLNLNAPTNNQCLEAAPLRLPALPTTGYLENKTVSQTLYVSDLDGDPLKISITPQSSGTLILVTDASTKFLNFNTVSSQTATAPSLYNFMWIFKPSINQVNEIASGSIKAIVNISYDTTVDSTLNSVTIASFPVDVIVENLSDAPLRVASEVANCGTLATPVACTADVNVQKSYLTSYTVLNDASPNGNLTNTRTGAVINYTGTSIPISNPLIEGETGTIQLPVIARPRNPDGLTAPVLYGITAQTQTCSIIKSGRVKIEETICNGSSSLTKDCLNVYLNYNTATGSQDVIPRFTPTKCSFQITARDALIPNTAADLGTYDVYIQDVNSAPYLLASPPTTLESFLGRYPVEGETIQLKNLIHQIVGDSDFGAYNKTNSATTTRITDAASVTASSITMLNFNAADLAPEFRVNIPTINATTLPAASFTFQISADNSTWENIPNNTVRREAGGFILELQSNGFTGTVTFQRNTNMTTPTWTNFNVTNLNTMTTTTSTTGSGRYYFSAATTAQYRAQITSYTAGSMTGRVIGSTLMENTASSLASGTVVLINPVAVPTAVSMLTELPIVSASALTGSIKYIVPVNPAKPYFRAVIKSPTSITAGTALPAIAVDSVLNDPAPESYYYNCFVVNNPGPGETYTNCTGLADSDGNSLYPLAFRQRSSAQTALSTIPWTIPYSFAVNGNVSASAQRTRTSQILLRIADKGFYNNTNLSPTVACQSGSPFYSCVDHRFDITAIENSAIPTIEIYDNTDTYIAGAKWRPQNSCTTCDNKSPIFTVNEGSETTFKVKISPYSNNEVDQFAYKISPSTCTADGGSCLRTDGTSLLLQPVLAGDFRVASGPTTFEFKAKPNYTEGISADGSGSKNYNFVFKYGEVCEDANLCELGAIIPSKTHYFGFTVKVYNVNRDPTGISLVTDVADPNDFISARCGDPAVTACSTNTSLFRANIDMSKAGSKTDFYVPLKVVDPDLDAFGKPSDNLSVGFKGISPNKVTLVTSKVDGVPYTFLKFQLRNADCKAKTGGTTQNFSVNLQGTDGFSATKPERTLTISVSNITGLNCLN